MKRKEIVHYVIVLVMFLFFLKLVEKTLDYFIRFDYNKKPGCAASGTINADVLIQGASRVAFGMNTSILHKKTGLSCYNLGLPNSYIDESLALLEIYLKNNKKPKYLFLEVSANYFDFNQTVFHSFLFVPYMEDELITSIVRRNDFLLYTLHYFPLFKYSIYNGESISQFCSGLSRRLKNTSAYDSAFGYKPMTCEWDGKFDAFKEKNPNGISYKLDESKMKSFIQYMDLIKKYNIKLFLYEAPILKEALPYFKNHDSIANVITKIASEYNVTYVSFANLPMNSNRLYFVNSMHTCATGSDTFTEIFYDTYSDWFRKLKPGF